MVAMAATHFQKVEAFLQALGTTRSPQMLVMVSRILAGASIQQVTMSYAAQQNFQLQVILATPYGETDSPYESTNINDAGLLRHFGIMTMNGQPLFDGFYALHLGLEETPA